MKRFFTLIVLLVLAVGLKTSNAQFEYAGGGINLTTGSKYNYDGFDYKNNTFGIDLRAVYDYSKKLQIVPDFKFYLPKKDKSFVTGESKTTVYALNINAHYILNSRARESYRLYLLAGAHVSAWNIKDDHVPGVGSTQPLDVDVFKFFPGANVGAGMTFPINSGIIFFAEAKYTVAKTNQLVFTPGVLFVL